ncbi:unnamed protein product [Bursaphelenchus okinawaensis]|uniref:G_PROTEIN_RECEP_F1_2 domain-containing protein n=1 Tax=Bursaphelenchus okinawaensis TaxID=465554 RepID=A0A811K0X4_9BILA|nr:unnamed protein product [Bursaphelenchus okinawaensis]CAG9088406.1 unnamed protein product [Bursaphelenchus okinawaensis]
MNDLTSRFDNAPYVEETASWYNANIELLHDYIYIIALISTAYFFVKLYKSHRIHKNFRLVLVCAAASFVTLTGTRIVITQVLHYTSDVNKRYYVNVICITLSTIHMMSLFGTALCMNMLAVEQHLATVWVNNYENKNLKIGIILMIIVVVQCVPGGMFVQWYCLSNDFNLNTSRTTCVPLDTHWELAVIGFSSCFVTCSLCSLPSLIGYMTFTLFGFVLSYFRGASVMKYGRYNIYDRIVTNIGYVTVDLYALYHMFCFMYYSDAMRFVIQKDIRRFRGNSCSVADSHIDYKEEADKTTETYFNQLTQAWR